MTGFEIFGPNAMFDPAWTGPQAGEHLLAAAQHFPGGPIALVFALFWAPIGPGIPAGVVLARHVPLPAVATFGLYALSDACIACIFYPIFAGMRRGARRVPLLRALGRRFLKLATWGVPASPPAATADGTPGTPGAPGALLLRIGTVAFGADVYTGGLLATTLPVRPLTGWAVAIAGDLVWFAVLLASSVAAAGVFDDDRFVGIVVLVAMVLIPRLARRLFPVLRG